MAMFLFAKAITEGKPIYVFNHGNMRRDFTYIDDIVSGIIGAMCNPPVANPSWDAVHSDPATSRAPWAIYNLGNNTPSNLMDVIGLIEKGARARSKKEFLAPATRRCPGNMRRYFASPKKPRLHRSTGR